MFGSMLAMDLRDAATKPTCNTAQNRREISLSG